MKRSTAVKNPFIGKCVKYSRHAVLRAIERHDSLVWESDPNLSFAFQRAKGFLKNGLMSKGRKVQRWVDQDGGWRVPMGQDTVIAFEGWVAILRPMSRRGLARNLRMVTCYPAEYVV